MFTFNPGNEDMSGRILGGSVVNAANTTAQANVKLVDDIGGALMGLASSYAENRAMKAEAEGYDKIGEILGGSMFKDNPAVGGYLADLRKQKDPQVKISGYNALFNLAGPMSNAMMAQNRLGVQQNQQALTATLPDRRAQAEAEAARRREGPYISGTALPGFP